MIAVEQFRLEAADSERQVADLVDVASGAKAGTVDGTTLEAQFAIAGGGYLLVTSDDDPFEACLHLTLVDASGDKIDGMRLGAPYRSGAFRLRGIGPGESFGFSFFGEKAWRLAIAPKPSHRFARPLGPAKYTSPFLKGHRLVLTREAT